MIRIVKNKSIFDTECEVIAIPVNCVGVMNDGLALDAKNKYQEMFENYRELSFSGHVKIGKLWIWTKSNPRILLFPTRTDWRNHSEVVYIEKGLDSFINIYKEHNIKSIAFPLLGCGSGGLDPEIILYTMHAHLGHLKDIYIEVYDNRAGVMEHVTPNLDLRNGHQTLQFPEDDIIDVEEDKELLEACGEV